MRVGHLLDRDRPGGAARRGSAASGRDGRRRPGRRGLHRARRTSCPAVGERRFTVAALDLGIKAMTPRDDGRARHRGARAARDRDARRRAGRRRRRAVLLQRPRRPGGHRPARSSCCRARWSAGCPYFGICFGNQLFGRALGFGTYKLKYGHRGINQPVMDRTTGKVEVTAHNHGFAVDAPLDARDATTPYGVATVSHVCLNDDVVEGLELRDADGG